jgi:hypothetical protein
MRPPKEFEEVKRGDYLEQRLVVADDMVMRQMSSFLTIMGEARYAILPPPCSRCALFGGLGEIP